MEIDTEGQLFFLLLSAMFILNGWHATRHKIFPSTPLKYPITGKEAVFIGWLLITAGVALGIGVLVKGQSGGLFAISGFFAFFAVGVLYVVYYYTLHWRTPLYISKDLVRFHLHDSLADRIHFDAKFATLRFELTLCDAPEGYRADNEFFGKAGILTFNGIQQLKSSLPLETIGQHGIHAQILDMEHKPELDQNGLEGVYVLIGLTKYPRDSQSANTVMIVEFLANHFIWMAGI